MVEHFRHSAKIRTNDPKNRVIELVVHGRVDLRFKVTPGDVWEVGELSRTEPTKFTGYVYSSVVEQFAIKSVTHDEKKLKITPEPMTAEELKERDATSGYAIHVEIPPTVPVGTFAENVVLMTDDESQKELPVQVHGRMNGPIEFLGPAYRAETSMLLFGEFPADKGKEVTLSLFVRNFEGDLELLGVDPPSDRVQFELKKLEKLAGSTQRYQLKVRVLPGPPINLLREPPLKFNLRFNHPEAENVSLDVRMLAT
jgi:hypothetical protein